MELIKNRYAYGKSHFFVNSLNTALSLDHTNSYYSRDKNSLSKGSAILSLCAPESLHCSYYESPHSISYVCR